jgi:hypothetical protein
MAEHRSGGTWTYRDGWQTDDETGTIYQDALWLLVGSLLIAAGSTLALIRSFEGATLPVYAGFLLFFLGYRLSQYGLHEHDPTASIISQVRGQAERVNLKDTFMIIIGGFSLSYGFSTFIQGVNTGTTETAIFAGVLMLGGYMVAHLAVNNTLI